MALKYSLKYRQTEFTQEDFVTLVKIVCHSYVSPTNKDLMRQIKSLETIFDNGKLQAYFDQYSKSLSNFAIRERSGILSPDATLRATAINIGVALAS